METTIVFKGYIGVMYLRGLGCRVKASQTQHLPLRPPKAGARKKY